MKRSIQILLLLATVVSITLTTGCKGEKSERRSHRQKQQSEQVVTPVPDGTAAQESDKAQRQAERRQQREERSDKRTSIADKFAIEAIEGLDGSLLGGWTLKVRVRNDSAYSPRITSGKAFLYNGEQRVACVMLAEAVEIPKRQTTSIEVPLTLTLDNPLQALVLLPRIKNRNFEGMQASMTATVEVMGINRTIEIGRTDINTILTQLGYNI
ncbi:MAG: hypothetical protein IJ348_05170 [Alistipes sp.]|nr:hypothetical protein [Alistipes sp.]